MCVFAINFREIAFIFLYFNRIHRSFKQVYVKVFIDLYYSIALFATKETKN